MYFHCSAHLSVVIVKRNEIIIIMMLITTKVMKIIIIYNTSSRRARATHIYPRSNVELPMMNTYNK